jgi:hypothetical protein
VTEFGPQPQVRRYATIQIPGIYGNHVPYDRGQNVKTPDVEPGKGKHGNTWNASLIGPTGDAIALWVYEIEVGFELGGSTAQSRRLRQFFPHSFSQVKMQVRGQAPNNYQYNRLASFVRMTQYWALYGDDFARFQRRLGQPVSNRHYPDGSAVPTTQLQIRGNHGGNRVSNGKTIKGPYKNWNVDGYIKNVQAGASRFEFAKDYEFEFEIAYSAKNGAVGIFEDSRAKGQKILPWMDIFKKYHYGGIDTKTPAANPLDLIDGLIDFVGDLFK